MRKATPALKYCRGEPFKEEHWSALLQVPPFPRCGSIRTLYRRQRLLGSMCTIICSVLPGSRGLGQSEFFFIRRGFDFEGKGTGTAAPR